MGANAKLYTGPLFMTDQTVLQLRARRSFQLADTASLLHSDIHAQEMSGGLLDADLVCFIVPELVRGQGQRGRSLDRWRIPEANPEFAPGHQPRAGGVEGKLVDISQIGRAHV